MKNKSTVDQNRRNLCYVSKILPPFPPRNILSHSLEQASIHHHPSINKHMKHKYTQKGRKKESNCTQLPLKNALPLTYLEYFFKDETSCPYGVSWMETFGNTIGFRGCNKDKGSWHKVLEKKKKKNMPWNLINFAASDPTYPYQAFNSPHKPRPHLGFINHLGRFSLDRSRQGLENTNSSKLHATGAWPSGVQESM